MRPETADGPPRSAGLAARDGRKIRPFGILMAGSSISMFGSRISTVAFPMLVLHLSGSPFMAGLVVCASILPGLLVQIPAGAVVDRYDPRYILLVSELGRGAAVALVVAKLAFGRPTVSLLIIAMVIEEILEIFSTLADRRYVNCLAENGDVSRAQACIEVRAHAVVLAGRPIGPFLFGISPILPFLADMGSFVISALSLACIRGKSIASGQMPGRQRRKPRRQMKSDIRDGFLWLHGDKHARTAVALMAGTTLIAQALIMIFLAEAHAHQLSSAAIGVVLAASGAGGLVGSVTAGRLPRRARKFWLQIQMCAWSVALALLAVSGGNSVPGTALAMVILGLTGAIGNVEFGTYLVEHAAADGMLARVTSIGQVLAIGACALGPMLGGTAIQWYGTQGAVVLLLALIAVFALISLGASDMRAYVLRPVEWSALACVAIAECCRTTFRSCRGLLGIAGSAARTVSDVLDGSRVRLPDWRFVAAFVAACRIVAEENGLDGHEPGTIALG